MTSPLQADRELITAKFNARLGVYREKRERADAFAKETCNRHEAYGLMIEAIELLALECGLGSLALEE